MVNCLSKQYTGRASRVRLQIPNKPHQICMSGKMLITPTGEMAPPVAHTMSMKEIREAQKAVRKAFAESAKYSDEILFEEAKRSQGDRAGTPTRPPDGGNPHRLRKH